MNKDTKNFGNAAENIRVVAGSVAQKMADARLCVRCGQFIPEGQGLFHTLIHALVCMDCKPHVIALEKDYGRSRRGRKRTQEEFLRAIRREAAGQRPGAGDRAADRREHRRPGRERRYRI